MWTDDNNRQWVYPELCAKNGPKGSLQTVFMQKNKGTRQAENTRLKLAESAKINRRKFHVINEFIIDKSVF